jgi:hypothetical protein
VAAHGDRLSKKQEQAIAALLAHPTIDAAAQAVGVNEKTLRGWLRLPAFEAAYRAARNDVLERTVAGLLRVSGKAVTTLEACLDDGRACDRIRAALGILTQATRGVELLDLAGQLAELRAMMEARHVGDGAGGGPTEDGTAPAGAEVPGPAGPAEGRPGGPDGPGPDDPGHLADAVTSLPLFPGADAGQPAVGEIDGGGGPGVA